MMEIVLETSQIEADARKLADELNQSHGTGLSHTQLMVELGRAFRVVEDAVQEATGQPAWRWGEPIRLTEAIRTYTLFEEDDQEPCLLVSPKTWRIGSHPEPNETMIALREATPAITRMVREYLANALFIRLFGWSKVPV